MADKLMYIHNNACEKTTVMKEHVKEVFECKNVTKTHCTTLWKLDDKGMKVPL